jgi:hypothetical protein
VVCCGLVTKDNDKVLVPVKDLPQDIGISFLLHPLVGGKTVWGVVHCLQNQNLTFFHYLVQVNHNLVGSGVMTMEQYTWVFDCAIADNARE